MVFGTPATRLVLTAARTHDVSKTKSQVASREHDQRGSIFRTAFGDVLARGFSGNIERVRQHGLLWALKSLALHVKKFAAHHLNVLYDKRRGIDTSGKIMLEDLDLGGIDKSRSFHYEPVTRKTFHRMMAHLPPDLSRYTFIDFGSGKGRSLLMAADYNFQRIVGVEFARNLHAIAEANLCKSRASFKRCRDVSSACINALDLRYDASHYVLFFFAPFHADIVRQVLDTFNGDMQGKSGHAFICYADEYWSTIVPLDEFDRAGFTVNTGMTYIYRDLEAPTQVKYVIYERGYGSPAP